MCKPTFHKSFPDKPALRGLLIAVVGALHFLAVPCAMAFAAPQSGEECEHCDVVIEQSPCMTATDESCADAAFNADDRLRVPPPADEPALVLPLPVAPAALLPAGSQRSARVQRTGRHTGDPPLNLLHGNFRK